MFRTPIAAFTLVTLSIMPSFANAAVSVPINALSNCFDTGVGSGGVAKFQLPPGRYVASLVSNKMSCSDGNLSGGCLINTVVIRGGIGEAWNWGVSIKTPTVIDVPGTGNSSFVAFVVDEPCSDNTGTTSLRFQKAQ